MVNTSEGPVAAGGQCFYWLHTHTSDGVIHIESPTQRIYTLGQFFDEWHQPLSANQVGELHGKISRVRQRQAVDEERARDPAAARTRLIQFDIGEPTPPLVRSTGPGPASRRRRARAGPRDPRPPEHPRSRRPPCGAPGAGAVTDLERHGDRDPEADDDPVTRPKSLTKSTTTEPKK